MPAKENKEEDTMRIAADDGVFGRVRRFFAALAAVLVIAMITFFFVARTEWARSTTEERLSKRLGVELSVGRTAVGWPYALVLHDVVSHGGDAQGLPWFEAEEIRMGAGINPYGRVTLDRAVLRLVTTQANADRPEPIRRLASVDLTDVAALSRLTAGFRDRMTLNVRNSRIEWLDGQGRIVGSARGLSFRCEPVRLPNQTAHYLMLDVYDYEPPAGEKRRDYRREWLTGNRLGDVELSGDPRGMRSVRRKAYVADTHPPVPDADLSAPEPLRPGDAGPAESDEPDASAPRRERAPSRMKRDRTQFL